MESLISSILLLIGVAIIIKGGELFVTSSEAIAVHAKLPRALVGGTLVSLATTAPELAVSTTASLRGNPGLAVGNAVGSAICNIGLIVGVLCFIRPVMVRRKEFAVPAKVMLASGVLLTLLTIPLQLARPRGLLLMMCALGYLIFDYSRHHRESGPRSADEAPVESSLMLGPIKATVYFAVGAGMVLVGSHLMSDNGVKLATMMGVPPIIIGLTIVAVGTSLPELVTAVTAARKGVPELSLGNVVGANILNLTLITGVAGTIHPLTMTRRTQLYNFPAMLVIFVLFLALARSGSRLTRREGVVLLTSYAIYIAGLFLVELM